MEFSSQCFFITRLHYFQVIEQNIAENTKIKEISEVFAMFLETAPALENFSPGLFVTDRSQNDMEPHTFSLCFKYVLLLSLLRRKPFTVLLSITSSSPAVIIQLVKHCHNLRSLSLLGYEELSDIVLEFISGEHEDSPGLSRLESITLPDKSFLTPEGVRSLLRHLPLLHTVNFPGKNKQ